MIHVRSTGCGRLLGILLVIVGAFILLSYYRVIPTKESRWWPVIIIILGLALLARHYIGVLRASRSKSDVLAPGTSIPILPHRNRGWSPPVAPLVIMALGCYLLLSNLHYVSLGVVLAVILILIGAAVLLGGRGTVLGR